MPNRVLGAVSMSAWLDMIRYFKNRLNVITCSLVSTTVTARLGIVLARKTTVRCFDEAIVPGSGTRLPSACHLGSHSLADIPSRTRVCIANDTASESDNALMWFWFGIVCLECADAIHKV